ncbi:MAG: sulfotransferase family 2 domain-containing protein [Roseovarius sp.]
MSSRFSRALAGFQKARHFSQNVYAVEGEHVARPVIYLRNHKAACTTIIATLAARAARKQGREAEFSDIGEMHRSRHDAFAPTRAISLEECYEKVTAPESFTFSFVRHPLQRAASAFADKVMGSPRHRVKLLRVLGRAKDESLTFPEFIRALVENEKALDLDRHWRPQHKELAVEGVSYDYLGAMDHLSRDLPPLLDTVFGVSSDASEREAPTVDARRVFGHRTRSADLMDQLHASERRAFEAAMAEDYALYEDALTRRYEG